jgi:hypothetical protein
MNGTFTDTHNPMFKTLYKPCIREHTPTPFLKNVKPTTNNIHNLYAHRTTEQGATSTYHWREKNVNMQISSCTIP